MRGSVGERRARLVARHLLGGTGATAVEAARSVVVLHATDPATVYLSVLARCRGLTIAEVVGAQYDDRALVRMMAMRRTLFVVPAEIAPIVHHAAALDVAATMRSRLLADLGRLPTDPPLPDDVAAWLAEVEAAVEVAVGRMGSATGSDIGAAEPRLRTAILPSTGKSYDVRRTITTRVLTLMGAEGRLVRGRPVGSWTSRRHTWEAGRDWWPDGPPAMDARAARVRLVEHYLRRFGPADEADVAWWTGWPLRAVREALAALPTVPLGPGLVLADDADADDGPDDPAPVAALLPALDPTPMGWRDRGWFLPPDPRPLYDRTGNVGPTVWWCGEVVGGWAVRADGSIVSRLLLDRGREAVDAVEEAVARLRPRLEGTVVVPAFRTPLERELAAS